MSEAKRTFDKNARNGEDALKVLADDIERYELLSVKETKNVLHKVQVDILSSHVKSKVEKLPSDTILIKLIALSLKKNCLMFSSFLSTVQLDAEEITKSQSLG